MSQEGEWESEETPVQRPAKEGKLEKSEKAEVGVTPVLPHGQGGNLPPPSQPHQPTIRSQRCFIRCDQFTTSCAGFLGLLSRAVSTGIENLASRCPSLSSKVVLMFLNNTVSILDPQVGQRKRSARKWRSLRIPVSVSPHGSRPFLPTVRPSIF